MLSLEAPPPTRNLHPGGSKFVQDPQGVLPPGGSGLLPNGRHRAALGSHVLIQS